MTRKPKFLFDECLPRPVVENHLIGSLRLYGAEADIAHLLSKYPQGVKDKVWIPEIASEEWVIVTADGGAQSKKSEKLPLICRSHLVSHVVLSRGLHKRKVYFKFQAITSLWSELLATLADPRGTGYSLHLTTAGTARLTKVWEPPGQEGEPEQKNLVFGN